MGEPTGTFAPLRHAGFARILAGALLANLGNAIQTVGASWHLTAAGQPADVIALVQTMYNLPIMLLALPAGAFADMFDRRRIILAAMAAMLAVSLLLAWLASSGSAGPVAMIGLTALLASGVACFAPAMSGSIGASVPRVELAASVALNITAFNAARSIGPAVGGWVVSLGGAEAAFAVNAVCYSAAMLIFLGWRAPAVVAPVRRPMLAVIREGLAFAFASREIRTIMARGFVFCTSGAAVWALMPLVAEQMLGRGSAVFGLLLGALGLGAVIGAASATRIRARFSAEVITRAAGLIYGACCLAIAAAPGLATTLALLVAAGAGWVQAMSGFAVAGQMWAPRELVGRITALVSSLTFGGIALGSWLWGHVAEDLGVAQALGASGALMVLLPLLGLLLPMPGHAGRSD